MDDRNQFDMCRSMKGGVPGLRALIADFHDRGVKVLLPYNPWDQGTRQERCGDGGYPGDTAIEPCVPGAPVSDAAAMAALLAAVDGDGFNGDTMSYIPEAFYDEAVSRQHPIAIEAEGCVTIGPRFSPF